MPLWTIHHTPGIFSDDEKRDLASRIADHYEKAGLPRFYVVTIFNETRPEDFYVGGEPTPVGVRVSSNTSPGAPPIFESPADRPWINGILTPFLDRHPDLHWEFHVDETSEELWMIGGIVPPPGGSEAEKAWGRATAPSPY